MKKIVIALGFAIAVASANAAFLYWQVSDGASNIASATAWAGGYDTATVWAYTKADKSDKKAVVNSDGYSTITTDDGESGLIHADIDTYYGSSYSYFIELASSSGATIATSEGQTYAQLQSANVIYDHELDPVLEAPTSIWHGINYKAAPEPTSAMLMLIGVAGLALRRKQRKA